jgi:hypothetical protein
MKSAADAAAKWKNNASGAGAAYVAGATAAANSQAQNAIAQADAWLTGVTQAGTARYTSGLQAAQQQNKYANRINAVGNTRFTSGVTASVQTFQTQIGKVLNAEAAVQLSPRGPKGSQANINRSTEMQQGLRAAKLAGQFQ